MPAVDHVVTSRLLDQITTRRQSAAISGRVAERGSLTVLTAVVAVSLLMVSALVVDGGAYLAAQRSAIDLAEQAARQGADQVSQQSLRSGVVALSAPRAVAAAEAYLDAAGHPGTAWVSGQTVHVSVAYTKPADLLGLVGLRRLDIRATASAQEVHGIVSADP